MLPRDKTLCNTWLFRCALSSVYTLLFCLYWGLNIFYCAFLTSLSRLCLTLSKCSSEFSVRVSSVQSVVFLHASYSLTRNYSMLINPQRSFINISSLETTWPIFVKLPASVLTLWYFRENVWCVNCTGLIKGPRVLYGHSYLNGL
jgi:hypothetical protein